MNIDLWERGCERLAAELPEQQYNTWIRPLPAAEVCEADGVLLVGLRVPNRFKLDWIRSQYGARIEELLSEIAGRPVRLELSLLSREATSRAGATVRPTPAPAQPVSQSPMSARAGLPMPTLAAAPVIPPQVVAVRPEPASQAVAVALATALPSRTTAPRRAAAPRQAPEALPVQALLLPELALNPEQPPLEPPAPRRTSTMRAPASRTTAAKAARVITAAAAARPVATITEPIDLPLPGQLLPEVEIAAKAPEPALVVLEPPKIVTAPTVIARARASGSAPASNKGRLNPLLTFENLVGGRSNQMARTAAVHVAGAPSQMYNPLYIYGGVGLGKTHLIHAVGNALIKDRPDAKVLYLHSEQFISDVVRNYQRKTFDELKAKYHTLDLLLIDDVQFFAGKDRTQEEFFTAFEALLAKRAHIIMTSDTYPKGLVDIDERLTSRFDAGLTVAIEPPELEMRVAILIRKGELEGVRVPEEVAFFIAKNVRANVRELEGALRKVLAYSRFSHKGIDIHLAREALKDLLSIQNKQISVENIQRTVADFYKVKVADLYGKKRPANIARARQVAMYLSKEMTSKSLPQIGELFGGRDHTTVLYAVRKIATDRQKMPDLNQQLHVLEQTLKS